MFKTRKSHKTRFKKKKTTKNEIQNEKLKKWRFFHFEHEKMEKSEQKILFIEIIRNNGAATVIRIRRFNSSSQIMHFTNEFMYCICKQKKKNKQTKLKTTNQPTIKTINFSMNPCNRAYFSHKLSINNNNKLPKISRQNAHVTHYHKKK